MKKSTILLIAPVFALTACASPITAEEAKVRAKEIEEHQIKVEDFNALSVEYSANMDLSGSSNGESVTMSMVEDGSAEINVEKSFLHYKAHGKEVMDGMGQSVNQEETEEMWAYIKEGKFYTVEHEKSKTSESKTYSVVEGSEEDIEAAFKESLTMIINEAAEIAKGEDFLAQVSQMTKEEAEPSEEGYKYEVKFSSSGEGSLIVKGKVEAKDVYLSGTGAKGSGKGSVSIKWDNYLISSAKVSIELSAKDGKNSLTMKSVSEEKLRFKAKVSYPDLSEYKKL